MDAFVDRQVKLDDNIREVFDASNRFGTIGNRDRENYATWTGWGFGHDAILAVAKSCAESAFPFRTINRILAEMRARKIFDADGITKALSEPRDKKTDDYMKHEYSEEQLNNVIVNFDDWVD